MAFENIIPQEVQESFGLQDSLQSARVLGGGMINSTVIVERLPDGTREIYQSVAPMFTEQQTADYSEVSAYLRAKGWEVPGLVPTESGELTTRDLSGRLWRGFEYVPSDVDKENTTLNHEPNPIAYGILLAKLHRTLASFDYKPRFQLPNFHDTDHYAEVLQTVASGLPTTKAQTYAAEVLEAYAQMPSLPAAKEQLIHGDPRTANTLSRDGEPFTFIDWDTEMIGTRWTDLGDMLRSLAEDAVLEGNPIPFDQLINIANGYREEAFPDVDASEFRETAIVAARRIAIELAMRFVADYKDGSEGYFAYDEAAYPSRHTFTMERAKIQMQIFDELKSANLEKGDSQDATSD